MSQVRLGIIGLGNIGRRHAAYINNIPGCRLAALCDPHPNTLEELCPKYNAAAFADYRKMLAADVVDAILIATPHPAHPEIAIAGFEAGKHVLCEKPIAVSVASARPINLAYSRRPDLKFSVMYQQRTWPAYKKLRELVIAGEVGEITRISWTITEWFRTWIYYASGGWRATWAGEGGGVLINQCPHQLDMIQWIPGMMPRRITAVAAIGKTHPIETEDEVSAILEYDNGATGHFMTTTGEAPGTNRLEIAGDRGRIVAEDDAITFRRTNGSVKEFRQTGPAKTRTMPWTNVPVTLEPMARPKEESHINIVENFVRAILYDEPLIAPGDEGIRGLEIGNAMLMAGLTGKPMDLPLDGEAYEEFLGELVKKSALRKAGKV